MNKKTIKRIYNVVIIALVAAAAIYALSRVHVWGKGEYTDDAQVQRHITPINTRVQGFIREVRFEEYQHVRRGDTLVVIDNSEYLLQLARAEAALRQWQQGSGVISAGVDAAASNLVAATAGQDEAAVELRRATDDYQRYTQLLKNGAVTQQQYDDAQARYLTAQARYQRAKASRSSTWQVRHEQSQRLSQHTESVAVAEAEANLAKLNLSYCVIVAPTDGYMGRKDIHQGQLVQPGEQLARIVDDGQVWVIANYRETQLSHIDIGSQVEFTADALPDITYRGTVEAISPATGAAYSTMPADNATGNFVKVEQRVPVRIAITAHNDSASVALLRAGQNVEAITY